MTESQKKYIAEMERRNGEVVVSEVPGTDCLKIKYMSKREQCLVTRLITKRGRIII